MLNTLALAVAVLLTPAAAPTTNPLTPAEKAAGWKVLFDGSSTAAFRGYKKDKFPDKGWDINEGALHCIKGGGGGDIVTVDEYEDFELVAEFKCSAGANSGIMYRVGEEGDYPWRTGPEYQVLDDALHPDGKDPKHRVGSLYDMIAAPDDKPACPAGQWNTARIRISHGLLQHFLNGKKVVETRIDGNEWTNLIKHSKFKDMTGFGTEAKGHLAFQDHGDEVWFRNIRVRDLSAKLPGQVDLFNEKDFSNWTWFTKDGGEKSKIEDVWSYTNAGKAVADKGTPIGYIATTAEYTSYVLFVSWRWAQPPEKPGNSGVLLRVQKPDNVWPKSIEAQLLAGSAGDFYSINEFPIKGDPARTNGRHVAHARANERPQGEWNDYEIIVDGETITLNVNGEELNKATGCQVTPGRIALQAEGAPIWFRDVRLVPLK